MATVHAESILAAWQNAAGRAGWDEEDQVEILLDWIEGAVKDEPALAVDFGRFLDDRIVSALDPDVDDDDPLDDLDDDEDDDLDDLDDDFDDDDDLDDDDDDFDLDDEG